MINGPFPLGNLRPSRHRPNTFKGAHLSHLCPAHRPASSELYLGQEPNDEHSRKPTVSPLFSYSILSDGTTSFHHDRPSHRPPPGPLCLRHLLPDRIMGAVCGKEKADHFSSPGRPLGSAPPQPTTAPVPAKKVGGPPRTLGGSGPVPSTADRDEQRQRAAAAAEVRSLSFRGE